MTPLQATPLMRKVADCLQSKYLPMPLDIAVTANMCWHMLNFVLQLLVHIAVKSDITLEAKHGSVFCHLFHTSEHIVSCRCML